MRLPALVWSMAAAVCVAVPAQAQTPRYEVSAGALFAGGYALGSQDANLVRNQAGGPPYALFQSSTRLDSAPGFEARARVRLSGLLAIEGGLLARRPELTTRLSADVEGASDLSASETISSYIVDAAVVVTFGAFGGGRATPFVRGGVGYLRELHEENVLVETGTAIHAGGGLTVWFGAPGTRRLGARFDARIYSLQGGIDFGKDRRTMATGGAALAFAF